MCVLNVGMSIWQGQMFDRYQIFKGIGGPSEVKNDKLGAYIKNSISQNISSCLKHFFELFFWDVSKPRTSLVNNFNDAKFSSGREG